MTDTIEVRVGRGFALLTEKLGPGWIHDVNLETLDITLPCQCVLGQIGHYEDVAHGLGLHPHRCQLSNSVVAYGFDWFGPGATAQVMAKLTAEWKRQILAARALDAVQIATPSGVERNADPVTIT